MDLYDCQGRHKGLTHTTTQAPQDGNFYLATRIWVRDAAGAILTDHPVESFTSLSHRQYSHRLLPCPTKGDALMSVPLILCFLFLLALAGAVCLVIQGIRTRS